MKRKEKDMYLPFWVGGFGFVCLACAIAWFIYSMKAGAFYLMLGIVCVGFGAAAVLCWWNQSVRMIGGDAFIYRTMFGREIQYRFSDIRDLKYNADSMTLILENGKVHIESRAIKSERFIEAVNAALKKP